MIDRSDILAMLDHWLNTPVNGYFGSGYGADLNSLLLKSMTSDVADRFIEKMKRDLPILQQLDADQLAIYSTDQGFERKVIVLQVGDIAIDLTSAADNLKQKRGETYRVGAV